MLLYITLSWEHKEHQIQHASIPGLKVNLNEDMEKLGSFNIYFVLKVNIVYDAIQLKKLSGCIQTRAVSNCVKILSKREYNIIIS